MRPDLPTWKNGDVHISVNEFFIECQKQFIAEKLPVNLKTLTENDNLVFGGETYSTLLNLTYGESNLLFGGETLDFRGYHN